MKYIDLFAGCGGLSLGLERCGFQLELAVEKSDLAGRTFYYNFISKNAKDDSLWKQYLSKSIEEQYLSKLIISPVGDIVLNTKIISSLKKKNIDLVAGGPPCQGFSMAGKRQKSDPRNQLVWDFLDVVKGIEPKFVIIENVLGINRAFNKNEPTSFSQIREELKILGYRTQGFEVNAKNYGVPQNRPRMIILGIRNDVVNELSLQNEILENIIKDNDVISTKIRPIKSKEHYVVKDAFDSLGNSGYTNMPTSKYAKKMKDKNLLLENQVIRNHSEKITNKFKLIGWLYENKYSTRILRDIANNEETSDSLLKNATYPIKLFNGMVLAKNSFEFENLIKDSISKKQSQKFLDINKIAPTVMSSSDDCINPIFYRGLTVREMARLQSFPDNFIFLGKETTGGKLRKFEVPQYTQVGNAVPPLLGEALGKMIFALKNE